MTDQARLAEEIVDAVNDLAGRHEGHRALHAKGTLLTGTFTGTADGRRAHDRRAPPGRSRCG